MTLTQSFGKTELLSVLAHSWVRWIVTTTNVGMRHSLLQFCKQHCKVALEAPGVCPTDSAEYTFQLTLQYLCDSALRWGMWIFLDDYRVPVGMGNREYIPCESYMPHILTRKNEPDPLVQTGSDTLPRFIQGLEPWSQFSLGRVNTEAFSECGHRNELISIPWAYDKGSTKGIYFNRGLIT